jgi:hypothetical protein
MQFYVARLLIWKEMKKLFRILSRENKTRPFFLNSYSSAVLVETYKFVPCDVPTRVL